MQVAGDRGSNYNAFTLFLIFILLYLSQKGVNASAYSQSGDSNINHSEQPEMPLEKQVAVGLSNGDMEEYSQEPVWQAEEQPFLMEDETEEAVVEETEMSVEPDNIPLEQEELPVEQQEIFEQPLEEEDEQFSETTEELAEEVDVPENYIFETKLSGGISKQFEAPKTTEEVVEEFTHEDEPETIAAEEEVMADDQIINEEPILGGQSNLFLKPTVMTGVHVDKKHSGPKISFKFGS